MNNNSLSNTISSLIGFILILLILFSSFFVAIAIVAAMIVPLTWIWGLITDQSYDRVCDNSEFIYQLNQIGKWTLVIGLGFLMVWIIF
jgi:hypothetical protein